MTFRRTLGSLTFLAIAGLSAGACRPQANAQPPATLEIVEPVAARTGNANAQEEAQAHEVPVRNVIVLIGDGMGPQQIGLLELYARYANDPHFPERTSNIGAMIRDHFTAVTISTPADGLVNESATGATQIATGLPTKFGYVGLNVDGDPALNAVEVAQALGMRTGIVSDTRLTHATPASFSAHIHDRWSETAIAEQIIASKVNVMLSGGWRYFLPKSAASGSNTQKRDLAARYQIPLTELTSRRTDERNLLEEAQEQGYEIATTTEALRATMGPNVIGLFGASGMQSGTQWVAERDAQTPSQPSLRELFETAVRLLHRDEGAGFFLMLEGGQIDWAGHATKAQLLLHEMLRFDETVGAVMRYANDHPDTVVILTADHETGGFSIYYDRNGPPQPTIFQNLDAHPNYVGFATSAHTHTPILTTFYAPASMVEPLPGLMHQVDVGQRVIEWVRLAGANVAQSPSSVR